MAVSGSYILGEYLYSSPGRSTVTHVIWLQVGGSEGVERGQDVTMPFIVPSLLECSPTVVEDKLEGLYLSRQTTSNGLEGPAQLLSMHMLAALSQYCPTVCPRTARLLHCSR